MNEITLKNFRCFREEQTVRLAPLTLLVGENSTGKTSFMAVLRALWDAAYLALVPDFKEEPYDLGSFDEIVHHQLGKHGRATTFEAGFRFVPEDRAETGSNPFWVEVTFEKRGTAPFPVKRRFSSADKDIWLEQEIQQDGTFQIHLGTPNGVWKHRPEIRVPKYVATLPPVHYRLELFSDGKSLGEAFKDLKLTRVSGAKKLSSLDQGKIRDLISSFFKTEFDFLGNRSYSSAPVRSKPRRTYDPSRLTRDPEGDYIPMVLARLHFQEKEKWEKLKNALEDFGKSAGLFNEIVVKSFSRKESDPFQIQIRRFGDKGKKGPWRSLIDVGYGVSQVLPVITELLRDRAPAMSLLQQPEVHLHPSAQAALGSLFCQIAKSSRQLIVETHSDYLLNRVRMDVRDGKTKLKPDDVSILYFERGDLDVHIHSLSIDREGNILGAPPSYGNFFMDEVKRSLWKEGS